MPTKRDILGYLTRDELLAVLDQAGLVVPDRRKKDDIIEALAKSKAVKLEEALGSLPRDRLKDLCRALGLEDSGKEKAVIIERLLGTKPSPAANAPSTTTKKSNGKPTEAVVEVVPGEKLSTQKLEGHLWRAADFLRGQIDSGDYKNFIFGLLSLKRLPDRFEEECDALRAEGADPDDPDEHEFFVPKRARWFEIQKVPTNLGETPNKACSALEENNATHEGVLGGIDCNDERKLGDARNWDDVLSRLVQHFSRLGLKNADLSEPDMLGRSYEALIEKFADDAGKKGGESYSPAQVVRTIVEILQPKEGMRICDPTCGSGGMLIQCAHYLERQKKNPKNLSLFGQERKLGTWAICKMNMLLHGLPSARIEKGDTIRDPKLVKDGALQVFDRVIANPPFSLDDWGRETAEHDPYGRFRYGVPPKTKGALAFAQHMVATTNKTGVVGVDMPHGVLSRGAAEGEIRNGFLRDDLAEGVIGLPPLPEQSKIAAILSSVDAAIEVTEPVIEQLQVVKKAMTAELLTRGIPGRHTKFKVTEIGEVPEEWEVVPLRALLTQIRKPGEVQTATGYREIGVRSHGKGVFHEEPTTGREIGTRRVFWVDRGCIVSNIVFAWEGAVAATSASESGMIASRRFPMFKPQPEILNLHFLRLLLQTPRGTELLGAFSPAGAGRNKSLDQGAFLGLEVPVPPIREQQVVAGTIVSLEERLDRGKSYATSFRAARAALMSVLLTGEVRVQVGATDFRPQEAEVLQ